MKGKNFKSSHSGLLLTVLISAAFFVSNQAKAATMSCLQLLSPEEFRLKMRDVISTPAGASHGNQLPNGRTPDEARKIFAALAEPAAKVSKDTYVSVLIERHTLKDYLQEDSHHNLAFASPMDVMSAAQRFLAVVYSQGVEKRRLPLTGEQVDYYPFFSAGLPITGGRRIIDNEKGIQGVVDIIKAQALGDRTGVSIPLLVGGAASGKSELIAIPAIGFENLSSKKSKKFATHTFTWTKLEEIPSIAPYLKSAIVDGKTIYPNIDAPMGDSPITILPTEVQNMVINAAREPAKEMLRGMDPDPFRKADVWSNWFRNEIIQHYSHEKGRELSNGEIVEVLNKHVIVKRRILGQAFGNLPIIDKQGNNLDIAGLFMTPDPTVKYGLGGSDHPLAYKPSGKVLKAHGNGVFYEEFLRNKEEFRDMQLSAFESRVLTVGGSMSVPFDAFMIAATNTANLDATMSEGSNGSSGASSGAKTQGTGYAAVSRFRITPMRYSVQPNLIGDLLLNGKMVSLKQQSLADENAPVVNANPKDLFPSRETLTKIETPDYRYRLWYGNGADKVYIAPHSLMLMAEIISATRIINDETQAKKVTSGKVLVSPIFRDRISRIKYYEGTMQNVMDGEMKELATVSLDLKEGESGMDNRDAGRWFTEALIMARKVGSGTMTPGIVFESLKNGLHEGWINAPDLTTKMAWISYADDIINQLTVPRLTSDISRALANGDRVVNEAYFDILDEMYARKMDENARFYKSSSNGQERLIDGERYDAVKAIYLKQNGRPLSTDSIALFHAQQVNHSAFGRVKEESLLEAISTYYAEVNTKLAGLNAITDYERTGEGPDDVRVLHATLTAALKNMGYNSIAIRDALMLIKSRKSQAEPVDDPR